MRLNIKNELGFELKGWNFCRLFSSDLTQRSRAKNGRSKGLLKRIVMDKIGLFQRLEDLQIDF